MAAEGRYEMGQQLLRNYRQIGPTAFHAFNQRVATALADKTRIPDSVWAGNPGLLESYLAASAKHDAVYHESMLGSKLVINEREVLQAQLVIKLDEVALVMEMAAVRNPGILVASGFDCSKERRGHPRAKTVPTAPEAAQVEKED